MLFTKIHCVIKDGNKVIEIHGRKAPQSSNGVPEDVRLRAVESARGPIEWEHPKHRKLFIQFVTISDTRCFVCIDPNNQNTNLLESVQECSK